MLGLLFRWCITWHEYFLGQACFITEALAAVCSWA